jgi:hypothetical protein
MVSYVYVINKDRTRLRALVAELLTKITEDSIPKVYINTFVSRQQYLHYELLKVSWKGKGKNAMSFRVF